MKKSNTAIVTSMIAAMDTGLGRGELLSYLTPPKPQRIKNPENALDKDLMLKADVKRMRKQLRNINNNAKV